MTPHGQLRPISIKHRLVYSYVRAYIRTYAAAPRVTAVAKACRLTRNQARYYVLKLELRGYVRCVQREMIDFVELTDKVLTVT